MATKTSVWSRIGIGAPLIGGSLALIAAGIGIAAEGTEDPLVRVVVIAVAVVLVVLLWVVAVRNGQEVRAAVRGLQEQHPGSLVERVRVWSLPHRTLEKGTAAQFLVADAEEIAIQTMDEEALIRIPVSELGFVGLVTAQGDRVKDKALTLIYGDDQNTVQLFTVTYDANDRLGARLRTAIGWPKTGSPTP